MTEVCENAKIINKKQETSGKRSVKAKLWWSRLNKSVDECVWLQEVEREREKKADLGIKKKKEDGIHSGVATDRVTTNQWQQMRWKLKKKHEFSWVFRSKHSHSSDFWVHSHFGQLMMIKTNYIIVMYISHIYLFCPPWQPRLTNCKPPHDNKLSNHIVWQSDVDHDITKFYTRRWQLQYPFFLS